MQNDIIVKKPPLSAASQPAVEQVEAPVKETAPVAKTAAHVSESTAPIGVITLAVFVCLCLASATVYGAMGR